MNHIKSEINKKYRLSCGFSVFPRLHFFPNALQSNNSWTGGSAVGQHQNKVPIVFLLAFNIIGCLIMKGGRGILIWLLVIYLVLFLEEETLLVSLSL